MPRPCILDSMAPLNDPLLCAASPQYAFYKQMKKALKHSLKARQPASRASTGIELDFAKAFVDALQQLESVKAQREAACATRLKAVQAVSQHATTTSARSELRRCVHRLVGVDASSM